MCLSGAFNLVLLEGILSRVKPSDSACAIFRGHTSTWLPGFTDSSLQWLYSYNRAYVSPFFELRFVLNEQRQMRHEFSEAISLQKRNRIFLRTKTVIRALFACFQWTPSSS